MKFHINKHGVPAPCKAKEGNCPLGGDSGNENHYNTQEEAQEAADLLNESEFGLINDVNASMIDSFVHLIGEQKIVEDFAYLVDEEKLGDINEQLIEKYELDVYNGSSPEQMLDIAEQISHEVILEELEDRLTSEELEEVVHSLNEEYDTKELSNLNRDINWQLRRANVEMFQSKVDLYNDFVPGESDIVEIANEPITEGKDVDLSSLQELSGSEFVSYGKLGKHRMQYYKQELSMNTEDKVEVFTQAFNEIKDEIDSEDDISHKVETIIKGENKEYVFRKLLDEMNDSQWGQDNKYFNKVDEILGVNSKSGFTSGVSEDDSKSIYLDNDVDEEILNQRSKMISKRREIYENMIGEDRLIKSLSEDYRTVPQIETLAKSMFNDEEVIDLTYQRGPIVERWERVRSAGVEKFGKKGFTNKVLKEYWSRNSSIEGLDKLDAQMNINSISKSK